MSGGGPPPKFHETRDNLLDDGDWVVIAFDAVDGGSPALPWLRDDLAAAVEAIGRTPAPGAPLIRPLADEDAFGQWHVLLDEHQDLSSWDPWIGDNLERASLLGAGWREAVVGAALLHGDLLADNMVRGRQGMLVVDRPYAASGAPWVDLVGMLPSVGLEGGGDPEEIWSAHPLSRTGEPDAVNAYLAAHTGYSPPTSALSTAVWGTDLAYGAVKAT